MVPHHVVPFEVVRKEQLERAVAAPRVQTLVYFLVVRAGQAGVHDPLVLDKHKVFAGVDGLDLSVDVEHVLQGVSAHFLDPANKQFADEDWLVQAGGLALLLDELALPGL